MTITHDALNLTIQEPPWSQPPGPAPPGIFKLVQLGPHCTETPAPDMFKPVYFETRMVGMRAVGILVECFFVISVLIDGVNS